MWVIHASVKRRKTHKRLTAPTIKNTVCSTSTNRVLQSFGTRKAQQQRNLNASSSQQQCNYCIYLYINVTTNHHKNKHYCQKSAIAIHILLDRAKTQNFIHYSPVCLCFALHDHHPWMVYMFVCVQLSAHMQNTFCGIRLYMLNKTRANT